MILLGSVGLQYSPGINKETVAIRSWTLLGRTALPSFIRSWFMWFFSDTRFLLYFIEGPGE